MFRFLANFFTAQPCEGARSPAWSRERAAWLKEHPECEACGTTDNVEVHHKRPVQYYPELELSRSNFISLCMKPGHECHYRIGHGMRGWNWFNPNVEADAARNRKMMNHCANERIAGPAREPFKFAKTR